MPSADRTPTFVRQLLWRRVDHPGLELFRLSESGDVPVLEGSIFLVHEGEPLHVEYEILCTGAWETRRVRLRVQRGMAAQQLELAADDDRRWWCDGLDLSALTGCVDVDINVTPATNVLPIRRLRLAAGDAADVTAAWIRVPELVIEPLPQRYVRTGDRRYRYESLGGTFTTMIEVDELGLVMDYPPVWERVAVTGR